MARPSLTRLAYKTLQGGKSLAGLAHKEISTKLMSLLAPDSLPDTEPISNELLFSLRKSISKLEKIDWQEAEEGVYPKSLLFDSPWLDWATRYPLIWLDLPSTWQRRKERNTRDIPSGVNTKIYPEYYLQNFHHQTDGYLSDHSASLYDLQVEILFNGTADSMRRRILAPLKRGLNKFSNLPKESVKILDVATGTGRTLKQIRSSLPMVELLGLDLSSSYLKKASKYLNSGTEEITQLIKENAENMPFPEKSMHGITCVYLLHEMPREARQNVINECLRVLKPGGVFILADSVQLDDSPQFEEVLENFHKVFHEPYYRDYIIDDISERIKEAGFDFVSSQSYFMTRIWTAYKPT